MARIAARVPRARTLRYRGDLEELLDAFAGAEAVIATRLHAMLLAFCHRRPVFGICYDKKMENVAEDMGFSAVCNISELENIDPKGLLSRCGLPEKLEEYQRKAAEQFAPLDAFLEESHGNGQLHRPGL